MRVVNPADQKEYATKNDKKMYVCLLLKLDSELFKMVYSYFSVLKYAL